MNSYRAPPEIAAADAAAIWIDFDGTLTTCDVIDALVRRFAVSDDWRQIEAEWLAGRIGSRECLAGQFDLVRVADDELDALLDSISLDPGAPRLLALARQHDVPVTVVSDGIDMFIKRVFLAHGLQPPRVRSNTVVRAGETLRLECPFAAAACRVAAAHCKCSSIDSLATPGHQRIYIGDGRSDLCAARTAQVRFAKGDLAARLADEQLPFIPFATLHDVANILDARWSKPITVAA